MGSLVLLTFVLSGISSCLCFNFETRLPIIKRGGQGTYFGFSVAQHITEDELHPKIESSWLLVGAPLDQNRQPRTNRSGALWRCPLTTLHTDCEQVTTDGKRDADGYYDPYVDNDALIPPQDDEIKNGQWLGVTVKSQGKGGKVLVCAHRYIRKGTQDSRWGRGLCYTLNSTLSLDETVEPCKGRPTRRAHEDYGYCQVGTSGLLVDDMVMVGSPGPFTWRGAIFAISVSDDFLNRDKTLYFSPHSEETSPVDKYSYLGMSVAAADFFGTGISFVAGAPRSNGTGQVIVFSRKIAITSMQTRLIISGDMYTSNFGYELATADVNGDKLPDLIVGAPNYFDKNHGGAIYIYVNTKRNCSLTCNPPVKIFGQPDSRFGISIANIGDINKDGFEDIAVGAPYEGNGAIYIYLGSKNGTLTEPSQVIRGEPYNIETFGYSLSGGNDLDYNGYPDLLAGAFESSAAVLLRTRPIIELTTTVEPETALKKIDPNSRSCASSTLACFTFKACVTVHAVTRDRILRSKRGNLRLNCTLQADITRRIPRVFIGEDFKSKPSIFHKIITLKVDPTTQQLRSCHDNTVFIKEDTKDIQTAVSMRMSYSIIQDEPKFPFSGDPLPSMDDFPILNKQQADKVFQATFLKDCGDNDICESQLSVSATLNLPPSKSRSLDPSKYDLVLGIYEEILLNITVDNLDESAYEAYLSVTHSPALSFIAQIKGTGGGCDRFPEKQQVICPLGNPLERNRGVNVLLRFEPLTALVDSVSSVNFNIQANTTSHQIEPQKELILVANVIRKADLKLRGSVRPEEVLYGGQVRGESEMIYKDQPGSRLRHTYQVSNDGPWHVNNLELQIEWPYQVANNKPLGKWLLYMDDEPTIEAEEGGVCDTTPGQVNPLRLIDRKSIATGEGLNASALFRRNRNRRDVEMVVKKGPDNIVHMNCKARTAKCFKFRCIVYKLPKKQSATVTIKARLWNSTLVEDYPRVKAVKISSNARLFIPNSGVIFTSLPSDMEAMAVTVARSGGFPEPQVTDGIQLWMILVGVVAGLLVLLCIALLFWKCGFFKRTRPDPTLSGNLEKHTLDDYHDY